MYNIYKITDGKKKNNNNNTDVLHILFRSKLLCEIVFKYSNGF